MHVCVQAVFNLQSYIECFVVIVLKFYSCNVCKCRHVLRFSCVIGAVGNTELQSAKCTR